MEGDNDMPGTKWILVVDDDADNRDSVVELLEHAGYAAKGASGGEEALDMLLEDRPCLVLADLIMNDMDGTELLVRARQLLARSMPPFVFVTGAHPSQLGTVDNTVLKKPLDFGRLLGAVEHHCGPA
jgi:CheY-like chemotaxis protein